MATAANENVAQPLVLRRGQLNQLIEEISRGCGPALGLEKNRYLFLQPFEAAPESRDREFGLYEPTDQLLARDDQGAEKNVVRLISHPERSQHLLLALTFSWYRDSADALRFTRSQVIVFLAWGDARVDRTLLENRKQLLRLEWEGLNRAGEHEARVAAHPHWQIDRWLAGYDPAQALAAEAIRSSDKPRDFSLSAHPFPPHDIHWIRTVHLAAAARWSTMLWAGSDEDCTPHATSPLDGQQLKNWTFSSLRYLRQQFQGAFDRA